MMWTQFDVKWEFVTPVCASVPGQSMDTEPQMAFSDAEEKEN